MTPIRPSKTEWVMYVTNWRTSSMKERKMEIISERVICVSGASSVLSAVASVEVDGGERLGQE